MQTRFNPTTLVPSFELCRELVKLELFKDNYRNGGFFWIKHYDYNYIIEFWDLVYFPPNFPFINTTIKIKAPTVVELLDFLPKFLTRAFDYIKGYLKIEKHNDIYRAYYGFDLVAEDENLANALAELLIKLVKLSKKGEVKWKLDSQQHK